MDEIDRFIAEHGIKVLPWVTTHIQMRPEQLKQLVLNAIKDVIYPASADGKRCAIFEWGHETTPTAEEMQELCEQIADAVLAACEVK